MCVALEDSEELTRVRIPYPDCGVKRPGDKVSIGELLDAGHFVIMDANKRILELIPCWVLHYVRAHDLGALANPCLQLGKIDCIID